LTHDIFIVTASGETRASAVEHGAKNLFPPAVRTCIFSVLTTPIVSRCAQGHAAGFRAEVLHALLMQRFGVRARGEYPLVSDAFASRFEPRTRCGPRLACTHASALLEPSADPSARCAWRTGRPHEVSAPGVAAGCASKRSTLSSVYVTRGRAPRRRQSPRAFDHACGYLRRQACQRLLVLPEAHWRLRVGRVEGHSRCDHGGVEGVRATRDGVDGAPSAAALAVWPR